ncbi:MAG: hypothetical protein COA84_12995 [Robiginitomaculum sp.]|nr:MAG: hypothetical protein COA84_12995 [Robiginitomaculum sp.]
MKISLLSMLTVLFIYLKLTGVILWSWWWVLSPLWGPFTFILGIVAFAALCVGTVAGIDAVERRIQNKKRIARLKRNHEK